jgi:NAD(P) transhydrogenase subunit alpha
MSRNVVWNISVGGRRTWQVRPWRVSQLLVAVLVFGIGASLVWGNQAGTATDAPSPSDAAQKTEADNADGAEETAPAAQEVADDAEFTRRDMLIYSLWIFALAILLGFEVITKVPPTLHTPLMSGSNAISGITIVGALIVAGHGLGFASFLGFIAVMLATINVVGGFLVTHRMLAMFKKR